MILSHTSKHWININMVLRTIFAVSTYSTAFLWRNYTPGLYVWHRIQQNMRNYVCTVYVKHKPLKSVCRLAISRKCTIDVRKQPIEVDHTAVENVVKWSHHLGNVNGLNFQYVACSGKVLTILLDAFVGVFKFKLYLVSNELRLFLSLTAWCCFLPPNMYHKILSLIKSTYANVMAVYRPATNHYLNQWWPSSMCPISHNKLTLGKFEKDLELPLTIISFGQHMRPLANTGPR